MRVVGVLAPTNSADDLAVFVDVKTAWVVQGLVHGHQDLSEVTDPTLVMDRSDGKVTATAKLAQYTQITPQNIDSFHFHGDPADYPITAVIALPRDQKAGAILRGRYVAAGSDTDVLSGQITVPSRRGAGAAGQYLPHQECARCSDPGGGSGHGPGAGTGVCAVTASAPARDPDHVQTRVQPVDDGAPARRREF